MPTAPATNTVLMLNIVPGLLLLNVSFFMDSFDATKDYSIPMR